MRCKSELLFGSGCFPCLDRADGFLGGVRVESAEGLSPRQATTEPRVSSRPKGGGKVWRGKWAHLGVLFWIEGDV